jgi:diguanylate cyclase (GGDEF)-like protein/PAS domain S-box-containing protein
LLLDAVGQAVIATDQQGKIVYWNRAAEELYGWSAEEAAGRSVLEVALPEQTPGQREEIMLWLREWRSWSGEFELRRKDGTVFPAMVTTSPVLDDRGDLVGIIGVSTDITERKRAEQYLREARRRYRTLVERVPPIIYIQSPREGETAAYDTTYISPRVEEVLGYPAQRFVEDPGFWDELIHPDDLEGVLAEDERTDQTGEPFEIEYRMIARDGRVVWVRDEATLVPDEHGNPSYWLGVQSDITDRKLAEEALKKSEERFRTLTQNSSDVVTLLTATGTMHYISPSVERILGYGAEEIVGDNVFDYVHPDDLGRVEMAFAEGLKDPKRRPQAEYRFRHKDGSWRWLESVGSNLLGDPGVGEYVFNSRDVTERKEAEARLREAEERYRTLVEQIPAVTYIDAADGSDEPLYTSPQIQQMLGHTPEEWLEGRLWPECLHPDDRERVLAADERFESGGSKQFREEYRLIAKDGSVVWVHEEAVLVEDELGNPLFWQGVLFDITEQKQAEEELRESEERLRRLADSAFEGILITDKGEILEVNRALTNMLGYELPEMIGRSALEFVAPDHQDLVRQKVASGAEEPYEIIGVRKDGTLLDLEVRGRAFSYRGLTVRVTAVRDITERKEAEEEKSRQAHHAALRADVSTALAQGGTLQSILQRCTEIMVRHLEAAFARIWTLNEEENVLELQASAGMYTHLDGPHSLVPVGELKIGLIAQERLPHLTNDVLNDPRIGDKEWAKREGMVAFAGYPLIVEDRLVGVMAMFARKALEDDTIEALASVADAIAQGIQRKWAEEALRSSEEFFRALYEDASHPIFLLDENLNFIDVNPYASEFYGYSREEFRRMKAPDISLPEERDDQLRHVESMRKQGRVFVRERRHRRKNGETVTVTADAARVTRSGQELYVIKITDITERKRAEERLQHQAFHDLLTGLPNRYLLVDRLKQALRHTSRRSGRKVAVLFVDLDDFKAVNDSLGHEVGDKLLAAVSERLRGCIRLEDTLARFGGDEFIVLLEEVEDPDGALRVAERLTEEFRVPFRLNGRELFVRISIGVALGTSRQKSAEDLLKDADTAMYWAKAEGMDCLMFDPQMYLRAVNRLELENDLRRAIEAEEFVLHYQPIVDLGSGEVRGVEALVRWNHPERGLLDPNDFVPVAEESGLIIPMGEQVLEEACRQAKRWQEEHPRIPPLIMSVNLSARQLRRPDLATTVEEILQKTGFEASYLSLDITETVYIKVLEGNTAALDKLKRLGVRIAIDDFGVGYSSLSYLKRLPADVLKIDKSFTKGIGEEVEDTAIIRMVIELAHTLGMEVIAEGVEDWTQAALLREMGCDMGQGFFFSKPLPSEEAAEFLAKERTS